METPAHWSETRKTERVWTRYDLQCKIYTVFDTIMADGRLLQLTSSLDGGGAIYKAEEKVIVEEDKHKRCQIPCE